MQIFGKKNVKSSSSNEGTKMKCLNTEAVIQNNAVLTFCCGSVCDARRVNGNLTRTACLYI